MACGCYAECRLFQALLMLGVANRALYAKYFNAECHYAECRYAECRCAELTWTIFFRENILFFASQFYISISLLILFYSI